MGTGIVNANSQAVLIRLQYIIFNAFKISNKNCITYTALKNKHN